MQNLWNTVTALALTTLLGGCSIVSYEPHLITVNNPGIVEKLPDMTVKSDVDVIDYEQLLGEGQWLPLTTGKDNLTGYVIEVTHHQRVYPDPLTQASYIGMLLTLGVIPAYETKEDEVTFTLVNQGDRLDKFSYTREYTVVTGLLMGIIPTNQQLLKTGKKVATEASAAYKNHILSSELARDEFKSYFDAVQYYDQ